MREVEHVDPLHFLKGVRGHVDDLLGVDVVRARAVRTWEVAAATLLTRTRWLCNAVLISVRDSFDGDRVETVAGTNGSIRAVVAVVVVESVQVDSSPVS